MKITDHIERFKGETQFTFEILPPLKGQNISALMEVIEVLMDFKPPFIDVTYHREEHVFKKLENGLHEKKIIRKRPGTVGICAAIQNKFNIDAVPHILCGGFNKEDTENFLIDLDFLGIDNLVALRGDAVKSETYFKPSKDGHQNFCVGVSGYPEKHMEAPSLESDLHFLKKKVESGADYIVTQMFFDNKKFFEFVELARKEGIEVPIIPGLKPLSTIKQLNLIPHRFHVDLPEILIKEIIKCKDNSSVRKVGIDWCIEQSRELKKAGVPFLHYYSMGKSDNIKAIAEQVF